MIDQQLVAKAAAYTTPNKHKGQTSMPSAGFELAILPIKRLQAYLCGLAETNYTAVILSSTYLVFYTTDKEYRYMFRPELDILEYK